MYSEVDIGINYQAMIARHKNLEINYEDFYNYKFITWGVFNNIQCQHTTMLKALTAIEKYRYYTVIEFSMIQKINDNSLQEQIIQILDWEICKDAILFDVK